MAKKRKADVEEETISSIAEFSEEVEGLNSEDFELDPNAEEILEGVALSDSEDYLEGAPAIIHQELQPVEVNDEYPTQNHIYCRTKASKTHREVAPEFNHTLIIREKK